VRVAERDNRRDKKTRSRGVAPPNRRATPIPRRVPLSLRLRAAWPRAKRRLAWVRQAALWLAHLVAAAAVVVVLLAAGRQVERYLRTSPAFATTDIEVKGVEHLSQADVERIAGLGVGKNVFDVGPELAAERLRAEPWIASASVRRRLPGSYRIEVQERHALALLSAGGLYLVGEDGAAFKQLGEGDPADLPVITGIEPAAIEHDKHAAAAQLVNAVGLVREYDELGLSRREVISEVHVEQDGTLSCYVGRDAVYVRLGVAPYRSKLRRLREVLSELASQTARASYVYLDNERRPDRVTVKLR
jgi:cell division protein FtsQ